jgi:hypothetical protein
MISLTLTVDNLNEVMDIFDTIQVRRYIGDGIPSGVVTDLVAFSEYSSIDGRDVINNRINVSDVILDSRYSQYYFTDPDGYSQDWYISRYFDSRTDSTSGWSSPVQGEAGDLYFNPQFPPEIAYGTADKMIINRIRLWTGDPLGLRREYGDEALSSIHPDGRTYEMDETGWPAYVNMGGIQFTTTDDPSVNGYRFLRFKRFIDDVCNECVTYSGICGEDVFKEVSHGVDVWYYTFRHSDRQIMDAYDSCPPPTPLSSITATSEAYMLQTSLDLLRSELIEDSTEDGASIRDEGSHYNPAEGQKLRKDLIDDLQKRLDDLIKSLLLSGITGVRVD